MTELTTATPPVIGTSRSERFRRVMEGLRIRSESGRIVSMRFSRTQEMIWKQIAPRLDRREKLWFICLKGRQVYASTLVQALTFVRTIEQPGTNSIVVAQNLETASDLFAKSKMFFETLPLPRLAPGRVAELTFPFPAGASRYRVIASSAAKGRGTTQTCIHLSECAYWEHPEVMTGLLQAIPDLPDTILVLESTANGMTGRGELFYHEWGRAMRGESDLIPIFLPWWAMEKYRRKPAIPMDDWDEEERLLAEQFAVDGEQIAWRRMAIKTKCLTGDTKVSTEFGIIPIRDAANATTTESGKITAWLPQGRKPVVQLITVCGRQLRGTEDHRIQRPNGAWTALADLKQGDEIALSPPRFAALETALTWSKGAATFALPVTEDVGLFLGYFMGDGSWHGSRRGDQIEITCSTRDADVVAEVQSLVSVTLGASACVRLTASGGATRVVVASTTFRRLFASEGLTTRLIGSRTKRHVCVPTAIWRSPRHVVRAFLSGLFEADGTAAQNQVRIASSHGEFLRDIQLLLLGFNITATLRFRPVRIAMTGKTYDSWLLVLSGQSVDTFYTDIGFRGARKQNQRPRRVAVGRQPAPVRLVDCVESVTFDGIEDTYDLTVETTHMFSAGGISVHNCRGSVDVFYQEYPASPEESFVATGLPAFDRLAVLRQRTNIRDPLWRGDFVPDDLHKTWTRQAHDRGPVRLWKHPEEGRKYVIGADTSEGIAGGDYSCAEILDMESLEQVASIHGHIPFYEFAVLLNGVGRYFNKALLCIEVYPQGHTVQDYLIRKWTYPNLHQWRGKPDAMDQRKRRLYGYETNVWSRPLLIGAGQRAINGGLVTLHENGLLDEIMRFSKADDGKYQASAGHDDRVIGLLLALRSREENYVAPRAPRPVSAEFDQLPTAVRVVEARDTSVEARRRISKLLREKAANAVKSWLEM